MLSGRGLKTLARNYRCRVGELDLVMLDGATLVIVEVRLRSAKALVSASVSVDHRKRRRIERATRHFLATHAEHGARPVRFDVVALTDRQGTVQTRWIRDAFREGD